MKKRVLTTVFTLIFSFSSTVAYCAEITAIDFFGKVIGKVLPDAKVINLESNIIGSINSDGQVINLEGDIVGGIAPQGVAIGNDFKLLGHPNQQGEIITPSGKTIGRVLPNGLVVDDAFFVIGAVLFPGIVYSDSGEYIGRLGGDGLYTNIEGTPVGFITPDGYAYKKVVDKYVLEGRLISSKMVLSLQGELIGSINPDGSVQDFSEKPIGRVAANGFVYDNNKQVVAKISKPAYAFDNIGSPIGFVTYDGKVSSKQNNDNKVFYNNSIINNNLELIGFSLDANTTATDLKGNFLGVVLPTGAVVKGAETKGFISARGVVLDTNGDIIGKIASTGPVFDYKSDVVGHALFDGKTYNMSGASNGYIKGASSYDNSGKIVGEVYSPRAAYEKDNTFIGISGVTNKIASSQNDVIATMFGYVFNQDGTLIGQSLGLDYIYNPQGSIIGLITAQGLASSFSQVTLGSILGTGFVVDELNKIIGKTFLAQYLDNSKGLLNLLISETNAVLNKGAKVEAKILPDTSVIKSTSQKSVETMPQIGNAYNNIMAVSYNGTLLGYVDYDNFLRDFSGSKIGSVSSGGVVVDNSGYPIGEVVSLGSVLGFDCSIKGVLNLKAEARNYRDVLQGKSLSHGFVVSDGSASGYKAKSGSIIDINGNIIGYTSITGRAYNIKGQDVGCVSPQGFIKKEGAIIGGVVEFYPVMDFSKSIIARSIIDGKVVDEDSLNIGYMQPSGGVVSSSGEPLGLLFKYKYAFDNNGNFLGIINQNAEVISNDSSVVGQVYYDGTVFSSNKEVGYALYDLYVYNKDFIPVGYINLSGKAISFSGASLGNIERGFVINQENEVIARGNRDYFIRDDNYSIIGELQLKGELINLSGQTIASINSAGELITKDNKKIAKARPLQYYSGFRQLRGTSFALDVNGNVLGFVDDFGNVYDNNNNLIGKRKTDGSIIDSLGKKIGSIINNQDAYDKDGEKVGTITSDGTVVDTNGETIGRLNNKGEVVDNNGNIIGGIGKNWYKKADTKDIESKKEQIKDYIRSMSIALTPDGEYLGEILEDGSVVDKNGNILGKRQPDGLIIDDEGTLIGTEEADSASRAIDEVFVPAGSFGDGGAYGIGQGPTNLGPGGGHGPGERYDPQRAQALSFAQQRARQNSAVGGVKSSYSPSSFDYMQDNWEGVDSDLSSWRVDMSEMILADKPIPAVLARSIYNTSTEVPVTAIVERNVYSEEGRNIIIPSGSRLIGKVGGFGSSQNARSNASKVEIQWDRLIRPDGSMFKLTGSVTGDAQGRQGALGYVDNNLAKKYTAPVLTTLLTSGVAYMMASDDETSGEIESSKQQAADDARQNFIDSMDEVFQEVLQDSLDQQVLIFIPAGTRIVVYPNKDLWLRNPERDKQQQDFVDEKNGPVKALILPEEQGGGSSSSSNNSAGGSSDSTPNEQIVYSNNPDVAAQQGGTALVESNRSSKKASPVVTPPPPPTPTATGATTNKNQSAPVLF